MSGAGETVTAPPASAADTFSVEGTQLGALWLAIASSGMSAGPGSAAMASTTSRERTGGMQARSRDKRLNRRGA